MPLKPDGREEGSAASQERPAIERFEMDASFHSTRTARTARSAGGTTIQKGLLAGTARHTLGLLLLLVVVFLWTLSNFLGSSIFADNSYAKPFFLTYLNTSTFTLMIIPTLAEAIYNRHQEGQLADSVKSIFSKRMIKLLWTGRDANTENEDEREVFIKPAALPISNPTRDDVSSTKSRILSDENLGIVATARLSLTFCILWFIANYFAMACLQYTTVASATIITATSSVWTLLVGALTGTERFTWQKLCGVLASLAGVAIISQVDLTSNNESAPNENLRFLSKRVLDQFPHKPPAELLLGDAIALISAVVYGFYTIALKKTTLSVFPKSIHMPTFFGLVGIFNIILLFPLFPVLHFTDLEPFELPPNKRVWTILLVNSASSLLSDICWAYAMVLTSPLLVTVGLSLTIPLSLIGEMIIQGRFETWVYWIGAMVVVGSFIFVERVEKHEGEVQAMLLPDQDLIDEGEPGPALVLGHGSDDGYDDEDFILDIPPSAVASGKGKARDQKEDLFNLIGEDDDDADRGQGSMTAGSSRL